jgi:hypothetical protein
MPMLRLMKRLAFRIGQMFGRRRRCLDADGNPTRLYGIHARDEAGEFVHFLVRTPIQAKVREAPRNPTQTGD